MKQIMEHPGILRPIRAVGRTLLSLRPNRDTLFHLVTAVLLCGIGGSIGPLFLGAALLCVCQKSRLFTVSLGTALGYACFWHFPDALPGLCAAGLMLLVRLLFPTKKKSARPELTCCFVSLLVGLTVLIAQAVTLPRLICLGLQVGTCTISVHILHLGLIHRRYPAQVLICAMVCLGLAGVALPGDIRLFVPLLAWLACAQEGLMYCAVCAGLLSGVYPGQALLCTVFCLSALLHSLVPKPARSVLCAAAYYCLWGLLLESYSFSVLAILGDCLALVLLPSGYLPAHSAPEIPLQPAQKELALAAEALKGAQTMLAANEKSPGQELTVLIDHACTQVCGSCARYGKCTIAGNLPLPARILSNGHALKTDLPEHFYVSCLHGDAFLTGLNDALDCTRSRRRLQHRARELTRAAGSQYRLLSDYLGRLSGHLYAPEGAVNFEPVLAVHAAGCTAHSGDRGIAFAGPNATYYILLCDGMGTGTEAAAESRQGITLLRQLLQAGMEPEGALCTLNNLYLIRDNGCFTTVDLARINLTSGDVILYKWGAAPSYLKRQNGLRCIGSGSLPPGISPGGEIQQLRLSLGHGSVLVLVSDGLTGKETLRRLESCQSLLPRDVVHSLFVGRGTPTDDCTAVALCLRRA